MSERLDLAFNALAKELKDIEDAITALKNKQFIGTDSIKLYKNLSAVGQAGGFDIDYTGTTLKNWSVLFIQDNQKAPYCDLSFETYIDGVKANNSELQRFDSGHVFFNTIVNDSFLAYSNRDPALGASMGWYFATEPLSGESHHIQVRMYVDAADTGTILVEEI